MDNQDSAPQICLRTKLLEAIPELKLFFSDEDDYRCFKLTISANQERVLTFWISFLFQSVNFNEHDRDFLGWHCFRYIINWGDFTLIQFHQRKGLRDLNLLKFV